MNTKVKKIIISLVSIILIVLIVWISYVKSIRKSAMEYIRKEYSIELKNIEKNTDLDELSDENWQDYYMFVRLQEDEKIINFKEQVELMSFFDTYEDFSNVILLKENYVDKK